MAELFKGDDPRTIGSNDTNLEAAEGRFIYVDPNGTGEDYIVTAEELISHVARGTNRRIVLEQSGTLEAIDGSFMIYDGGTDVAYSGNPSQHVQNGDIHHQTHASGNLTIFSILGSCKVDHYTTDGDIDRSFVLTDQNSIMPIVIAPGDGGSDFTALGSSVVQFNT